MSIDNIFDEFDKEKKEGKAVPEEATEISQEPEVKAGSTPEGKDESKEEAEPIPSKEEEANDWFAPAEKAPTGDKPVDDQPVEEEAIKEEVAEEAPVEEVPVAEAPTEVEDEWFAPAEEEPTSDKTADDQPVEGEAAGETPAGEAPETEALAEVGDEWFTPAEEEPVPAETPSEMGADRGALIRVKTSPIVVPAVTADAMREQMRLFQSLKASLLDKNKDIVAVQGKPYIKRSGWRKLALVFNISDEILGVEKEEKDDDFEWRVQVRAWAPNGRSVVGIGACSSCERNFSHIEHDVYATAHTRAKNRALSDLIGSGEVSWEELRGFN